MPATKISFLTACTYMTFTSANQFFLNLHKNLLYNFSFMSIFHIILWNNIVILNSLFCKKINCISFLQKCISHILLVAVYLWNCTGMPSFFTCTFQYPIVFKSFFYFVHARALKIFSINTFTSFNSQKVFILNLSSYPLSLSLNFIPIFLRSDTFK